MSARRVVLVACLAAPAAAADLLLEDVAWGPIASRTTGVIAAERRPDEERIAGAVVRAEVIGGTTTRLVGADAVDRAGTRVADAGASIALIDDDHGQGHLDDPAPQYATWGSCTRRTLYLRAGTDPDARDFGRALVAGGGELLGDIGGGAASLHVDVGWSDERRAVWLVEGALPLPLPVHAIGQGDGARETFRTGLCLRWPCGAVARSPDEDPWMLDLAIDYVSTHDDAPNWTTQGALAELSLAWRFANHWYLSAQAAGRSTARRDDGGQRAVLTGSGGLGATW